MLLAWMRYVLICCRHSWIYNRVSDKISKGSFFAMVTVILTPALIWTIIMYFGSPATGNFWVFRPADHSTENESIIVFQLIPDRVRHKAKPIVIVMALMILLQLLLTLFFYIRICYDSFMSTLNVNLKRDRNHEDVEKNDSKVKKKDNIEMEDVQQNNRQPQETNSFHISGKPCSGSGNEEEISKRQVQCIELNNRNPAIKNSINNKPITDNVDAITELPDDDNNSNTICTHDPNAISTVSTTSMNVNSEKESKPSISKAIHKEKKDMRRKNRFFLPTADDYKNFGPAAGAYKVNIPLTKVVLCVSQRDIVCTASLSCQIICLIITHALMVYCFSAGGRKISLARYQSVCVCIEIASIINAFVDSLVSLLFSSNFREAAFKIVFPPKKNHLK